MNSDVLFVVSSLIRNIMAQALFGSGDIEQRFVLTHNTYFFKEGLKYYFRILGRLDFLLQAGVQTLEVTRLKLSQWDVAKVFNDAPSLYPVATKGRGPYPRLGNIRHQLTWTYGFRHRWDPRQPFSSGFEKRRERVQ